jgi:glycosyltransferase involved in cell wall biosynthesis
MKIVIDARESGTTTGRYVDKLIEYLHKLKISYEVTILTTKSRVDFFKHISPDFEAIQTTTKEFTFDEQLGFKKQIVNLKPDLVHFTMVQQPILYRGKVVTTMQDLTTARFRNPSKNWIVFTIKQYIYKVVNWYVPRKSKKIITSSEFVKKDISNFAHVPGEKFVVTYESADKIHDKPEPLTELVSKKFIFYTGRPLPHKNLPGLIKAFSKLKEKNPDLLLVLAGKKDKLFEKTENDVNSRGITGVLFPGFVSEGQLRWLYENCQAYVVPSFSEGFGLPGLEAMAMGAPVVSSNATCLPEIYGEAAQYFRPESTDDMVSAIQKVIGDNNYRQVLIKRGSEQIKKYSWQRMAEQTLSVYKDILG